MDFCDVAELVNFDLENEWKHLSFYTRAAAMVQGLHRSHLTDFFFGQARSELEHVLEFSNQIVALGGVPVDHTPGDADGSSDPAALLEQAIELEQEVVTTYTTRLRLFEEVLAEEEAKAQDLVVSGLTAHLQYLILFYEEQIQDSHSDLNELNAMLGKT